MAIIKGKIINLHNLLLLAILSLALWLRLWGIGFGLPYVGSYDDEIFLTDNALHLLRQGRFDLSTWAIGNAQIYLQAAIGQALCFFQGIDPDEVPAYQEILVAKKISAAAIDVPYPWPEFYWWGRASVAFLGGLSVIILYLIGREIKSSRVGLISAFFLAVASLHIEHSHYLVRTAPGTFFLLLAFYPLLLAYRQQKWTLYLLSLPLIYLAVYIKQNNLILLAPLSLALLVSTWREFQRRPTRQMIGYLGLILGLGLVILTLGWFFFQFNLFAYSQAIFNRIFRNPYVFGGHHFGYSGDNTFQWLMEQLFISPQVNLRLITIFAIPGMFLALRLKDRGWLPFTILLPYILLMSFFTVRFINWLIPLIPLLALWAALFLDWFYEQIGRTEIISPRYWPALFGLVLILISSASLRTAMTLNYYATQPDVRQVAAAWLEANLPPGSKVVVDSWGPYLADSQLEVVYTRFVGERDLQAYREEQVDYLVLNSMNFSRMLVGGADPQDIKTAQARTEQMQQIMTQLPLEREFVGPALLNPPVISVLIYKVQ